MQNMHLRLHNVVSVEQHRVVFKPDGCHNGFVDTEFVFRNKDGETFTVDVFSDGGLSVICSTPCSEP